MTRNQAFKLCEKLNPPMYPITPRPYGVIKQVNEYFVVHLPTKKIIKK